MSERVAVVTGSTKGIGLAIVRELCKKFDGLVYITGRSLQACEQRVEEFKKEGYDPLCHVLDINDSESIATFANFIKKNHGGLDVLVNNAAIAYKANATESLSEQAENTINVNFFSTLNVCKALFPLLRPYSRVVNISSFVGMLNVIPGDEIKSKLSDPNLSEDGLCKLMRAFVEATKTGKHIEQGWGGSTYVVSKVGITALTFLQQKAFDVDDRPNIFVNAVNPGFVDTDMSSHKGHLTPEEGAQAPAYLALLPPDVTGPKGQMVWNDKRIVKWTDNVKYF